MKKIEVPAPVKSSFIEKVKSFLKKVWGFLVSRPNPAESVIQWIIRQCILSDSRGNPSWTITLAVVVMVYIGVSMKTEFIIATSTVKIYDPATGNLISESMKGMSDSFWYMLIVLSSAVTYLFQKRSSKQSPEDSGGMMNTIIDTASTALSKIRSK
jgi:hypothetical protein